MKVVQSFTLVYLFLLGCDCSSLPQNDMNHQLINSATHQLMAKSISNMATHLDFVARDVQLSKAAVNFNSTQKKTQEIPNKNTSNNVDSQSSMSIGSMASSSSTAGEAPKSASAWVSSSQEPVANKRKEQSTPNAVSPSSLPGIPQVAVEKKQTVELPSKVAVISTIGNSGTNKGGLSVGSMASSSSSSGEGQKSVSAFASGSQQQPIGLNRKEHQSTNFVRASESGQMSVAGILAASPMSSSSGIQNHQVNRGSWRSSRPTRPTRKNMWSTLNSSGTQ